MSSVTSSWRETRGEEHRGGMPGGGGASELPFLAGRYGGGGAPGVLAVGESGDREKGRQTDATLYDFSGGHWGKMRSASDLLLH